MASNRAREIGQTNWRAMRARCLYPKATGYKYYGGAGKGICPRWRESFDAFIADMGPKPSLDHSIDRIENSRGYDCGGCDDCIARGVPRNARWATKEVQDANREHPFVDETGKRYGFLAVMRRTTNSKRGEACWLCRCDCGRRTRRSGHQLRSHAAFDQVCSRECPLLRTADTALGRERIKRRLLHRWRQFGSLYRPWLGLTGDHPTRLSVRDLLVLGTTTEGLGGALVEGTDGLSEEEAA